MGSGVMTVPQPWQGLSSSASAGVGVLLKSRGGVWAEGQWERGEGLEALL